MMALPQPLAHFGVRVACLFATRKVRRTIRTWYKWNYAGINREWAEAVYAKAEAATVCRDSLRTLVLGSSHGDYGFVPEGDEFNLCGASQDLYLSYALYERCSDFPSLKTVVLFYSVFSAGSETEKTIEKERCLYYKKFWDVPYRFHDESFWKPKEEPFAAWLRAHKVETRPDYRGWDDRHAFLPESASVENRVESHLKNNRRRNGQVAYVEKMIELANRKGHRFVVVIPPCRNDYTAFCPPYDELFSELLGVLRRHHNISLLSFWGDSSFVDSDFGDMDHLNRRGAENLTAKINAQLHKTTEALSTGAELLSFPVHGDHTGSLVALEKSEDFPFEIKRVYYIWGTAKDVVRGHHAHKNLEQVVVCTSGSCDFILDDGIHRETYHLDSPTQGLHIKNNVWREFTNFSPDCVVMVLASEHYNESDYIRNYDEFLRGIGK